MNTSELLGAMIIAISFTLYILSMTIFADKLDACEASLKQHISHYKCRFRTKPIPTINANTIIKGDQSNLTTTRVTTTKNDISATHSQNAIPFLRFMFNPLQICKRIISKVKAGNQPKANRTRY